MEFCSECKHKYSDGTEMTWPVKWSFSDCIGELSCLHIEARDSAFDAIVGDYSSGHFICIPSIDVGCGLGKYDDYFWNYEKLSRHLEETDAVTVATVLARLGEMEREDK